MNLTSFKRSLYILGYVEGGTQIQPFKSAGLMNFGFSTQH